MSTTLTRWRDGVINPMDWTGLFQAPAPAIRVEQFLDHGRYGVRAELPGFDPAQDVEVTVADGVLRINAERREEKHERAHSEFHYGRFVRTVVLPAGVDEKTATAAYTNGVLEVSFTLGEPKPASTRITIKVPPVDAPTDAVPEEAPAAATTSSDTAAK
jgi:HSP20 family protein